MTAAMNTTATMNTTAIIDCNDSSNEYDSDILTATTTAMNTTAIIDTDGSSDEYDSDYWQRLKSGLIVVILFSKQSDILFTKLGIQIEHQEGGNFMKIYKTITIHRLINNDC